ncbi:hypothetical protein EMIT0P291_280058 [Pseudomonas sp. IT-P291]
MIAKGSISACVEKNLSAYRQMNRLLPARRAAAGQNVFSRDSKKVPNLPFTALDSDKPEDLWGWMDDQRKKATRCWPVSGPKRTPVN